MDDKTDSPAACEKLVRKFCEAWDTLDIDTIMSVFAEDAVYHNVPVKPIEGRQAIGQIFGSFTQVFTDAKLEILNLAAAPGLVIAERIDYFTKKDDGRKIAIPVTGVFVIRNGKIKRFSDYFDLGSWERQSDIKL